MSLLLKCGQCWLKCHAAYILNLLLAEFNWKAEFTVKWRWTLQTLFLGFCWHHMNTEIKYLCTMHWRESDRNSCPSPAVSCATAQDLTFSTFPCKRHPNPWQQACLFSLFLSDCVTRQAIACTNQRKGIFRIFVSEDIPWGEKRITQQLPPV